MDFPNYLKASASEIEKAIDEVLANWISEVDSINPHLAHYSQAFAESCQGGKRLRGVLVKLGYEIAKHEENAVVLKPAAGIEIFQTAILTHDDIIDLSPTRRSKPTLYKALGGDHHAISQTICLGDIGFFIAARLLSESNFPAERKLAAISKFNEMVINTGIGEMLDIELPYVEAPKTEQDVMSINKLKTADYTIVYPLAIGATLGGAGDRQLHAIAEFGEKLGIAFQIQDDILGVFGNEQILGKSVTSDIEEGKNTLLIIQARKQASESQREALFKHYGKGKITPEEHELIKQIFTDTGALEYSRQKAFRLVEEAKGKIADITSYPEHQQLLAGLADFLIARDK